MINPIVPSPALVEFMGALGLDSIMLDVEQGPLDMERVEDMARAARAAGLCAIARVWSPAPWMVERIMFRGVNGIVVPRLESAAAAQEVVDNVHYCYPKTHGGKILIIQVETLGMVDELDDVLAIDGIDAYFIGPVDLAKAMGFGGDFSKPEVVAKMEEITRRIRGAGKAVASMVNPTDVEFWVGKGVNVLYAHVTDFMAVGAAAFLKSAGLNDKVIEPDKLRIWGL
jgi:2-keto-3-deoxy-L-rhamnonate aldolase RhmA